MRASAALLALALGLLAAGCGGGKSVLRVGVIVDCVGPFGSVKEEMIAGAELPFVERGAKLLGRVPSAGVRPVSAGGRRVGLLIGCADTKMRLLSEARRLVERQGVSVLVAGLGPTAGLALREYARRQPRVAFIAGPTTAPELTLNDPAPSLFRFLPDAAQAIAGLGSYAYRALGWRTAAVVGSDHPYEWSQAAGFLAEFCALGGTVEQRLWAPAFTDEAPLAKRVHTDVDGVFVSGGIGAPAGFLTSYARLRAPLARHVVIAGSALLDPSLLQLGSRLDGVVTSSNFPFEQTPSEQQYVKSFRRAFPSLPATAATGLLTLAFHDAVEAALEAVAQSGSGRKLLRTLATLELRSPVGPITLDANRQAVAPNYLSRAEAKSGPPVLRTLRVEPDVEETFGGYFGPESPPATRDTPACRRGPVAPWALRSD